jgi:hypothetical protein
LQVIESAIVGANMIKGRVVFVVGHANWGKSRTLRALTDGNVHQRRIQLGEAEFFIRRMSNDDRPDDFYDFVREVQPLRRPDLILAFCPKFQEPQPRRCLEQLQSKSYRLFFWVLRERYANGRFVTPDEIATLGEYGRVEIFDSGRAREHARARALRSFIENTVLR